MKKLIIALFAVSIAAITSCGISGGQEAKTADSTMTCIDSACADTPAVATQVVDTTKK